MSHVILPYTDHSRSRHHAPRLATLTRRAILTLILTLATTSAHAGETCDGWIHGPLHLQSIDINGDVRCSTTYNPPNGPPLLIIGGDFTSVGGVPCNRIAAWDGASWRALGNPGTANNGTNAEVLAVIQFNDQLIAGGYFTQAGTVNADRIAAFDFTTNSWQPLAADNGQQGLAATQPQFATCWSLAIHAGELVVGGTFDFAAGIAAKNIARYTGSQWIPLAQGLTYTDGTYASVRCIQSYSGRIYAGGQFDRAGTIATSNIARYNGLAWEPLVASQIGANSTVTSMTIHNNELALGGTFTSIGGLNTTYAARYNGTTYNSYGSGMNMWVEALHSYAGLLIAGTWQTTGQTIRAFNGSTWNALDGGLGGPWCFTLTTFNSKLIAGGRFISAGASAVPVDNVAQWSAATGWSALDAPRPQVLAMELLGSRIVAAGNFVQSTTDRPPANNIIAWNGARLDRLETTVGGGQGTNGTVRALKGFTTTGPFGSNVLIAGGDFTAAGGVSANRIAQYAEPNLNPPMWSAMGAGFNASVHAIERFNSVIYAGGMFTQSGATVVNRIAQYSGGAWQPAGTGMNGTVHALKVFNGLLYAGGEFTTAGGVSTGGLARWNGTAWSQVGGFFLGTVYTLEVHNGELIIGGQFPGLSAPNIAKYNGSTYSNLGSGGANGTVTELRSSGTHVYCSGGFTTIGGVNSQWLARWSAAQGWQSVGGGASEPIDALAFYHDELNLGFGILIGFDGERDGGGDAAPSPSPSKGWLRYSYTGLPWFATQPTSQSLECFHTATFTAMAAPIYGLSYQWRRNGIALTDGPTGHGNGISGANTHTLKVFGNRAVDAAVYDCVISNPCGSATSAAATLTNNCCVGDVNVDGVVNVNDLLLVINGWGVCPMPPGFATCVPDITPSGGDNAVNVNDLLLVLNRWGLCP